jgi:hypothetical protein
MSGDTITAVWCFECRDRRDLAEWRKTRHLTTGFMTRAVIQQIRASNRQRARRQAARQFSKGRRSCLSIRLPYEGARRDVQKVEDAVRHFRQTVWPIVHTQVNAERVYKGMRLDQDGITVLAFAMCGRIRIQVERGDVWCSAQGTEEDAALGIGLHGIGATSKEAVALWRDAIALFRTGAKLSAAPSVGIF